MDGIIFPNLLKFTVTAKLVRVASPGIQNVVIVSYVSWLDLCLLKSQNHRSVIRWKKNLHNKIQACVYVNSSYSEKKKPIALRVCSYCLSVFRRGKAHDCTKSTRHENITKLPIGGSSKSRQKIVNTLIRQNNTRHDLAVSSSSIDNTPLRIGISPPWLYDESKKNHFPTKVWWICKMTWISAQLKLRDLLLLSERARSREIIQQPNLKEWVLKSNHKLEGFYSVTTCDFIFKVDEKNDTIPETSHLLSWHR